MCNTQQNLSGRITEIPGLMKGIPTIRGMRFPVKDIWEMLASGMSPQQIVSQHPMLEIEDIAAAELFRMDKTKKKDGIHAA